MADTENKIASTNVNSGSNANKMWVKVCTLEEIPTDTAISLHVNGQRLTLTRCGEKASILQGFCSHMLFPLSGGKVENCVLTCALHFTTFNTEDGSVVDWSTYPPLTGKTLSSIQQQKALRTFETRVENGVVFILWTTSDPESVRIKVN